MLPAHSALFDQLQKELIAKHLILHDIQSCVDRDVCTVYVAAWQMEPEVDAEEWTRLLNRKSS